MILLDDDLDKNYAAIETASDLIAGAVEKIHDRYGMTVNTPETRSLAETIAYKMPREVIEKTSSKLNGEAKKILPELIALAENLAKKRLEDIYENLLSSMSEDNFRTLDFFARRNPSVLAAAIIAVAQKTNIKA